MRYFSTTAAARELGISTGRVRQLILAGKLRAEKLGREWLILPRDLDAARGRKPGRPWHKERTHGKA